MPIDSRRIGLQLSTLRRHLQSRDEIAKALTRVREVGYEQVELGGLAPLPASELRQLADAVGLRIVSSHESALEIVEEPLKIAERLGELGCRFVAYPFPHVPLTTLDQVFALADALSRAGEVLRSHGKLLTYHNHGVEFQRLGGKAILDWLYERSDPFMVHSELDTYYVQLGGGDPAGYCARLSGRLPLLHLQDYAIDEHGQPVTAPLGRGNLNLWKILLEAEAAACEHYIVAQDPAPGVDAFAEVALSLRYLQSS
jgi:sugar phosphate isomerase/epimerase